MKRFLTLAAFMLLSATFLSAQPRAKYVFYFIGDGMGVNQVNGAETYLAAREGRIGTTPLLFPSFPFMGFVTTYSEFNGVTDSAAAGTALASGCKTKNGAIGMQGDLKTPVKSVAHKAREHGAAVGITSSASIDHATPAVFYAHQPSRQSYYEIGKQLPASGFDFFAGSDFRIPSNARDSTTTADLYRQTTEAGYMLVRGYDEFRKKYKRAGKMVLFQPENDSRVNAGNIPYVLDRNAASLTLRQMTQAGIDFLSKQKKDGFFLMVEGAMIDMACHANDAAGYVHELLAMDSCIRMAYEFYEKHPDETLIVVTADHETGGLSLGRGPYELHLDLLDEQHTSLWGYQHHLAQLAKTACRDSLTWQFMQDDIRRNWGIWGKIEPTRRQAERIRRAYNHFVAALMSGEKKRYDNEIDELTYACAQTLDEHTLIGWQSGGHSNGYVGVYAVGVGAEQFAGRIDNTEIPKRILKAAGWE